MELGRIERLDPREYRKNGALNFNPLDRPGTVLTERFGARISGAQWQNFCPTFGHLS